MKLHLLFYVALNYVFQNNGLFLGGFRSTNWKYAEWRTTTSLAYEWLRDILTIVEASFSMSSQHEQKATGGI